MPEDKERKKYEFSDRTKTRKLRERQEVLKLRNRGMTATQIANKSKISIRKVFMILSDTIKTYDVFLSFRVKGYKPSEVKGKIKNALKIQHATKLKLKVEEVDTTNK